MGCMRLQPVDFEADPEEPFRNDTLNRRGHVEAFCSVLTAIEGPAVVLLNGSWGAGKTAFARMSTALLRARGVHVAEFNAWQQQHTRRPLVDLVSAISEEITSPHTQQMKKLAVALSWQLAKTATQGLIDRDALSGHDIPASGVWADTRDLIDSFTEQIEKAAAPEGSALVVFIDELDRCRPTYALELLEVVRHLFSVGSVIVVVGINREALCQVVGSLYGDHFNTDRYLRRFTDLRVDLPAPTPPDLRTFLNGLLTTTGLADRLITPGWSGPMLELVARLPDCSLRDVEQATHLALVALTSQEANISDFVEQAAMTLIVLRTANHVAYQRLTQGEAAGFEAVQALKDAFSEVPRRERDDPSDITHPLGHIRSRMDALLLFMTEYPLWYPRPPEKEQFITRYQQWTGSQARADLVYKHMEQIGTNRLVRLDIKQIAAAIDLIPNAP